MNRDYNAEDTRAFASETKISIQIKSTISITSTMVATTNTIAGPTGRENRIKRKYLLVSSSRKMVKVTERLVNKVAVDFFADQGNRSANENRS